MTNKYIAYYRVSTARQGQSGLGLEAQKQSVTSWLNVRQCEVLDEYVEIESGKRNDRPKLKEALAACKKAKATLIIAKLDRLARNVHFISGLMESGVEFIAVDNPHANKLMLHLLAAFAEHEREQISKRTKEALAAAKIRGVVLGRYGKEVLSCLNHSKSKDYAARMHETIIQVRREGHTTIRAIMEQLNRLNIPTARNTGKWHIPAVHKLLKRIEGLST